MYSFYHIIILKYNSVYLYCNVKVETDYNSLKNVNQVMLQNCQIKYLNSLCLILISGQCISSALVEM